MDELFVPRMIQLFAQLRRMRPVVFGSDAHEFALNNPLPEATLDQFERDLSIQLPHEYKLFITKIGNGGAGPFYGVFPLGTIDDGFQLRQWHVNDGLVGDPSGSFELNREWNDLSLLPSADLAHQNQTEYDRRIEQFERTYFRADLLNGATPVCHEGCALRVWLVVTAKAAGNLWEDRRSEYGGVRPLMLQSGAPATFGAWYREWLQDCLMTAEHDGR